MTIKAAIVTDIHANLPALTAALAVIDAERCDVIYSLGDVIGIGPMPGECLALLLGAPAVRFVMGNHDALFAFGLPDPLPDWIDEGEAAHQRWTHAQLDPALRPVVAKWPYQLNESIGGVEVAFLHYPAGAVDGGVHDIVVDPTIVELDDLFAAQSTPLVFYGHHHPHGDNAGRRRYMNPGALGCSLDPVARFAILTVETDGSWRVEHHAAPYDRTDLFRQFELRAVPERAMILTSFFGQARSESDV